NERRGFSAVFVRRAPPISWTGQDMLTQRFLSRSCVCLSPEVSTADSFCLDRCICMFRDAELRRRTAKEQSPFLHRFEPWAESYSPQGHRTRRGRSCRDPPRASERASLSQDGQPPEQGGLLCPGWVVLSR